MRDRRKKGLGEASPRLDPRDRGEEAEISQDFKTGLQKK